MDDSKNISSNSGELPSNEQLIDYVNNNLSTDEQLHLERGIGEDPFLLDAIEGLRAIPDKEQMNQSISELNKHLNKLVYTKTQRKQKRKLPVNQWAMLAVAIILFLSVITYFIIHLSGRK
jgi:hypothetical protein